MKIGTNELILLTIILIILFGDKKLPELVRGITESIREFKKSLKS
jgi:sec-independent protein translocase protein TatA